MPVAAAANELYKVAKSYGLSDHDFSAVIEALRAKLQHSEWSKFTITIEITYHRRFKHNVWKFDSVKATTQEYVDFIFHL